MKILGIIGSPRRGGNSERLLDRFLAGASLGGQEIETLAVSELTIQPCTGCGACFEGACPQADDMRLVYPLLREAEVIAVASPVYFSGVPASLKALIDRCQVLWVEKYLKGIRHSKRGYFFASAARTAPGAFDGALATIEAFFRTLDAEFSGKVLVGGLEEKGAIERCPERLEEAFLLGKSLQPPGGG